MKAEIFLVVSAFAFGFFTKSFLDSTRNSLRGARDQVRQESVASALEQVQQEKITPHKINESAGKHDVLNQNLNKIVSTPPPSDQNMNPTAPVLQPLKPEVSIHDTHESFLEKGSDGSEIWCQSGEGEISLQSYTCSYSGACYDCPGSRLIIPDYKNSQPLCTDGSSAIGRFAGCCLYANSNMGSTCPDIRTCIQSQEDLSLCRDHHR